MTKISFLLRKILILDKITAIHLTNEFVSPLAEKNAWAMNWIDNNIIVEQGVGAYYVDSDEHLLNDRQREVLKIYLSRHKANEHKMKMPPICNIKSSRTV